MQRLTAGFSFRYLMPGRMGGIILTMLLALFGWSVSLLPGLDRLGPLACTLVAAITYRHTFGNPEWMMPGIRFSSGTVLRAAIVLFGLRLDVRQILGNGLELLAQGAVTIAIAILAVTALGRWWKADTPLTLLLAFGTGICGAAAIAAVSPILRSKEEDTAVGAGMIALTGTLFAAAYMLLQPWLPLDAAGYGVWVGASLHEIAHVAMAAAPAGENATADALLAKLARVFLLVPVCLLLAAWQRRKGKPCENRMGEQDGERPRQPVAYPWFLLGFLALCLIGSYVLPAAGINASKLAEASASVTTPLLAMAMAGFGLHVNLRSLRSRALRPLAAMAAGSLVLSALSYAITVALN